LVKRVLQLPGDGDVDSPTEARASVGIITPTAVDSKHKVRVGDISPFPKVEVVSIRKASKSKGKTAILTASPYHQDLEAKKCLAEEKIAALEAKKVKKALAVAEKIEKANKTKERKAKSTKVKRTPATQSNLLSALNGLTSQKRGVKQAANSVRPECGIVENSIEDKKKTCDWISCKTCVTWYHESCAEVNRVLDDDYFICVKCC